jgi:hypothetical protein
MYDLIGSSYTLNDHALDGEEAATLVPPGGGKMPYVHDTSRTWVVGPDGIVNTTKDYTFLPTPKP